jgi:hypothetical protein
VVNKGVNLNLGLLVFFIIFSAIFLTTGILAGAETVSDGTKITDEAAPLETEESIEQPEETKPAKQVGKNLSDKAENYLRRIIKDLIFTLTMEEEFNDNVYEKSTDEKAALITRANLGVNYAPDFDWAKGHGKISFETKGGPVSYSSLETGDEEEDFSSKVLIDYMRRKWYLGLGYGITSTRSLGSEISTSASDDTAEYWRDSYTIKFGTNWEKIPWEIKYTEEDTSYDEKYQSSDILSKDISLTQYFRASPKTYFLINYKHEIDEYPNRGSISTGGEADVLSAGIKGKISSKVTGIATFGRQIYDPDSSEQDKETDTVGIELDYDTTQRLKTNLTATKGIVATEYASEDYVTTDKIGLSFNYLPPFSPKLKLGLKLSFAKDEYESGRKEDTYSLGAGFEHSLRKWLTLIGAYKFTERKSDLNTQEYQNNIISLKLVAKF